MQRSQKFLPSSDSSLTPYPPQHTSNKAALKPLFTQTPLSFSDREKKPSPPPRKRRKQIPQTPALTFNPSQRMIPSGRQEPPNQTPVFVQGLPTPISSTNESSDWPSSDEVDDHMPSDITAPSSHSTTSKRPRTSSGSDESPQPPTSFNFNLRCIDHYESPLSGGSSSSPTTSYGSSPIHPLYNLDGERQRFHPELIGHYCGPIGRVTPEVYIATQDYHPSQEGAWHYYDPRPNDVYRD